MSYCSNPLYYHRRATREVQVGNVGIGGDNPIRVQSMITCDTMDTEASIQQTLELAAVGCQIVRITAPTVKDSRNLEHIVAGLRERGCDVPIVADIHFKPEAAMEAAKWVEKVRVNPGNYADSKKFAISEYTDEQYAAELKRIREQFTPLVELCKDARNRHAHRHQPRLAERPHHEPLRRHAARHGGERAGIRPHRARARFSRFHVLDEVEQPEGDDRCYRLLVARLNELGSGLELSDSSRRHRGRRRRGWAHQERHRHRLAAGDGLGDTIRVSLTEDSLTKFQWRMHSLRT